ncbi:autotransporter domain-containing protein [Pseudomonas sp. PB120]|uniref:autotransporter domain-containing protein n=1 Tax=Pseudomonas sp. PB120 TaxID=2494700 RepID=UPI0015B3F830|nr:autotransporter domain-containing protein [Pseudomonas sp. PB120]
MRHGISLLLGGLCLLMLALGARPALAVDSVKCAPADRAITVARGSTYTIDLSACSIFGLTDNGATAQHGTISGLLNNGDGIATYTNNNDGATSDFFTLQDEDSNDIRFSVTITGAASPITVSPASLPTPVIGSTFSTSLTSSGGVAPYTYTTSDVLPAGLTLAANGIISGTPTETGSFSFGVTATDSTSPTPFSTTKTYSTTISHPSLALTDGQTLPDGAVSQAYTHAFAITGGTAPYTFVVESGSLPPGTTLSSSGLMSGTPSVAGDYTFVVKFTDTTGGLGPYAQSKSFNLKITAALQPPVAGAANVTVAANSTTNPITLNLSGGVASSVAVATAASHGTVTASGTTISYTPTAGFAGPDSFTYNATNTGGTSSPGTITITVMPVAPLAPTISAVVAGNREATVYFTPPTNDGGSTITLYTVTSTPGNVTGMASNSPITLTGLTNGTAYTFKVVATNAIGSSSPSAASSAVTPVGAAPTITAVSPNSGPTTGGTIVTITGSGFTGATRLTFGSVNASAFTVNSDTQITASSPTGSAGIVDVVVTTFSGTSTTGSADQFTYSNAPTVTGLSPASGPIAGGTSVTINGSGFTPSSTVTFGATAATGVTFINTTRLTASAPAGTGVVDVYVTVPGIGTSASNAADRYTYSDVAVGPVAATVAWSSSANSIALDLQGGSPTSVAVASNPAHGTATAVGTNITYTPTAGFAGADSFTYTATKNGTTSSPATVSITVSPPALTLAATGSWTTTKGQPYTQNLVWGGGMAPYSSYTVTGLPNGLSFTPSTANSVAISGTPTQAGSFSITASATDSSTGQGPFTQTSTFTLVVNAASALTLSPGATTFNATFGTAFSQTFTASGGLAPYTFAQSGRLPSGVTWNAATATLAGQPTESGDFAFTLTASDNTPGTPETLTQNYLLKVVGEIPVAPSQSITGAGPGQPVVINLTGNATGGPFTGARLMSMTPANAGTPTINTVGAGAALGNNYSLRFAPNPDVGGIVTLTYTLSNATGTSSPGVITISLTSRSDPSKDAEVQGMINAQASSSRRFASGQISNFQQRLEALHSGNVSSFSNGFTLTSASLQRQRQRQSLNDDPTGIEQWLQIQSAKLQSDQSLRLNSASKSTQALRANPLSELAPELGSPSADEPTSALAFWTSGTISMGDDSSGKSGQGQDFVTSGLSVGADYRLAPNLTVGLGFGYGHDKTDIGDNGSRSQADSYSLALYGSYQPIENVYLDGVLGYQRLTFDNRRYVTDNAAMVNGDRDGNQTFLSLAAGYEYRLENWMLSPYARLDLSHATLDKYRERGDDLFALSYDQQTVKTTSTSLGLRSSYTRATGIGLLTPSLRVEYQHDFQGAGDAAMRYAGVAGNGALYQVKLDALGQDRGVFGVGLGLLTESTLSLNMEYQYTLSSAAQKAQSMLFNLRKPF